MHRLTATFEDPEVEGLYRHDAFDRVVRPFTRFSIALTMVVFLAYGIHDALVVPAIRNYAWTLRFGAFAPFAIALIAFTYSRWYERFQQLSMLLLGVATNSVVILIGAAAGGSGFFIYSSYAALFVVLGPFIGKMSVATQTVYTLVTVAIFVVVDPGLIQTDIPVFVSIITTIVSMGGIGALAAYQLEVQGRDAFLQRRLIRDQLAALDLEKGKSDALLLNILPSSVADRLKEGGEAIADGFAQVTVLFSDIVGFTKMSDRLEPGEVVRRLNAIFSAFDAIADRLKVEKIKTIGDAYMVAGGLPDRTDNHPQAIADMALAMRTTLDAMKDTLGEAISIRIGIHTGPVVAGVIGKKKFIYDIWGDTVNTASRMESHALPGTIQVTDETAKLLAPDFLLTERGEIDVKGKGPMKTWFLEGRR
ncbi:MAG: adenylate/guanylate cyclase domain-containing protein [Polyangiaceae bacterium]